MHDTSSKQRACRLLNYQVHSGAIHDHLGSDHHSYFISVTNAKKKYGGNEILKKYIHFSNAWCSCY